MISEAAAEAAEMMPGERARPTVSRTGILTLPIDWRRLIEALCTVGNAEPEMARHFSPEAWAALKLTGEWAVFRARHRHLSPKATLAISRAIFAADAFDDAEERRLKVAGWNVPEGEDFPP